MERLTRKLDDAISEQLGDTSGKVRIEVFPRADVGLYNNSVHEMIPIEIIWGDWL